MTREQTLIYLAGYFDGEGSIQFNTHKRGAVTPLRVRVRSGDKEIIELFCQTFGREIRKQGRVPKNARRQPWEFSVNGKRAQEVLLELLPYLRATKKQQAEAVLRVCIGAGRVPLTSEEKQLRLAVGAFVTGINHRVTVETVQ